MKNGERFILKSFLWYSETWSFFIKKVLFHFFFLPPRLSVIPCVSSFTLYMIMIYPDNKFSWLFPADKDYRNCCSPFYFLIMDIYIFLTDAYAVESVFFSFSSRIRFFPGISKVNAPVHFTNDAMVSCINVFINSK